MLTRRSFVAGFAGVAGLGAVAALTGCTAAPEPTPSADGVEADVVVKAIDNAYEPAEVTVKRGQAIRWDFLGTQKHDVVADDGSFVSELVTEGSFTHVFEEAGEFPYLCSIHPEMTGLVTVEG